MVNGLSRPVLNSDSSGVAFQSSESALKLTEEKSSRKRLFFRKKEGW